jgi:hypothetical protein
MWRYTCEYFLIFFKYFKICFPIKGAYAPGIQSAFPIPYSIASKKPSSYRVPARVLGTSQIHNTRKRKEYRFTKLKEKQRKRKHFSKGAHLEMSTGTRVKSHYSVCIWEKKIDRIFQGVCKWKNIIPIGLNYRMDTGIGSIYPCVLVYPSNISTCVNL